MEARGGTAPAVVLTTHRRNGDTNGQGVTVQMSFSEGLPPLFAAAILV